VKKIWGYTAVDDEETFARLYEALLDTIVHTALFSGFCYTQFADTFQEANGLLNADRTPKLPFEVISAATRNVPLHPRPDVEKEGQGPDSA
jgi:hypothetical protein